jgi:hypothetical protein
MHPRFLASFAWGRALARALCCLMLLGTASAPHTSLAAPAPHEEKLRHVLHMLDMDKFLARSLQQAKANAESAPNASAVGKNWMEQVDPGVMETIVVEEMARFSTPEEVDDLLTFFATPTGKRTLEAYKQIFKGAPSEDMRRYFTPADQQPLTAFLTSPAARMLQRFGSEELKDAVRRRAEHYGKASFAAYLRTSPSFLPLRVSVLFTDPDLAGLSDLDDRDNAQWATPQREAVKQLLLTAQTIGRANQRYATIMKESLAANALAPDSLLSLQTVNANLYAVARVERALDERNAIVMGGLEAMAPHMHALKDPSLPAGLDVLIDNQLPTYMAFHDNQKRLFALYRRVLTLARDQHGHISYANNTLMFDSDAALAEYGDALSQFQQEAELESSLIKRMRNDMPAGQAAR